ncbi:MAG: hypothetical protein Q9177_000682 [Variospora cf. flavescens]
MAPASYSPPLVLALSCLAQVHSKESDGTLRRIPRGVYDCHQRSHILVRCKISRSSAMYVERSGASVVKVGLMSGVQDSFESSNKNASPSQCKEYEDWPLKTSTTVRRRKDRLSFHHGLQAESSARIRHLFSAQAGLRFLAMILRDPLLPHGNLPTPKPPSSPQHRE